LIGVVTVRDGIAVQSFRYRRYLPLGRPEILVENLDRWGADEILVQAIDRSNPAAGPDFALLDRLGALALSTPLIYAGGIRHADDARMVVEHAADRIVVGSLLHDDPDEVRNIADILGSQAVIASLPIRAVGGDSLLLDHRSGKERSIDKNVISLFADGAISEALMIDWRHDGEDGAFDPLTLEAPIPSACRRIIFGGLAGSEILTKMLADPRVSAAAIGNALSHREHALQRWKGCICGADLRPAYYSNATA
jgi:cyclase